MTRDRAYRGRHVVVGLVLALILVTAAFGAILGYGLPGRIGVDEFTVLGLVVPVTPASLAIYGGASVGVVSITFLLVVELLSRFDDEAV